MSNHTSMPLDTRSYLEEILIDASQIGEPNQCSRMFVIDKVFLDMHLIYDQDHALLPLLQLLVLRKIQKLTVDFSREPYTCAHIVSVVTECSLGWQLHTS